MTHQMIMNTSRAAVIELSGHQQSHFKSGKAMGLSLLYDLCVSVHTCSCVCLCVHERVKGQCQCSLHHFSTLLFGSRVCHWTQSSLILLGWLSSRLQESSCLCLPSTRVIGAWDHNHAWLFYTGGRNLSSSRHYITELSFPSRNAIFTLNVSFYFSMCCETA